MPISNCSAASSRSSAWNTATSTTVGTVALTGVPDPGVFATGAQLGTGAYVIGALYVQAAYALAYATGRIQRRVSLKSIEALQRTTRVASQRAASSAVVAASPSMS